MNKIYLENFVLDELYKNLFNETFIKKLAVMLTQYNKERTEENKSELKLATQQLEVANKEINGIIDLVS